MEQQSTNTPTSSNVDASASNDSEFDYSFINSTSRIATYDNMQSAPRITKISPAPTDEYINDIAVKTYEQAKLMGGNIPFTVIKEVSENFIHAHFREVVISVFDDGNTIRFSDQGPGIIDGEKAIRPGFSSATEAMKDYIRGVGSGLPIVKDYLDGKQGSIVIDSNITNGAVVTISLNDHASDLESAHEESKILNNERDHSSTAILTSLEKQVLKKLLHEKSLSVTDASNALGKAPSSTYAALKKLEEAGLVEKLPNKKRILTDTGLQAAQTI